MNDNFLVAAFFRVLVVSLLPLVLVSCDRTPVASDRNPDTLVILIPGGDERIAGPAWDAGAKMLVFHPLVIYEDYWCPGEPIGGLAKSLVPSEDHRLWTVSLREDINWHDGTPVTAHDIKFTVDLWNHPDVQYYAGSSFGEVTVLDDHTLEVRYDRPRRSLLGGWDVFYPRHLLEDLPPAEFMSWEFWSQPVGNGPFRYVRHARKTMMELEANQDYYLGQPRIPRIVLKFGADGATGIAELKSGAIDVGAKITPLDALALRDDPSVRAHFEFSPGRVQIAWNHRLPQFADARLRRALTLAIDRQALRVALGLPEDLPLTDGIYTTCQFTRGEFAQALPYDPARSGTLMMDAGWLRDEAGYWADPDGRRFSFTLLTQQDINAQAAVFIQSQLREAGFDMKIQPLDNSMIREAVEAGDFEAAMHLLGANTSFHHRPFFSGASPLGYRNETVEAMYTALSGSVERDAWDDAYRDISKIFLEDMPVTFLYPMVSVTPASNRVRGFTELGPGGRTDFNITGSRIHEYWLEAR